MAEKIALTQPEGGATTDYFLHSLTLERGIVVDPATGAVSADPPRSFIAVILIGEFGRRVAHRWTGAAADADIVALNKANLTTASLQKRVMQKLIGDGVIAGAVAGAPD